MGALANCLGFRKRLAADPPDRKRIGGQIEAQHRARFQIFKVACRQADRRQLKRAAKTNFPHRRAHTCLGISRMTAPPAPVRGKPTKDGIGHHSGKRQVEQSRTVGHANLKTQAESFLVDRDDARHLGLHLAVFKVEAETHRLPGRGQLATDDFDDAAQNCFFNVGQLAQRTVFAFAAKKKVDDRSARPRSSCNTESAPNGSSRTEGDVADLGDPKQKLVELDLLRRTRVT